MAAPKVLKAVKPQPGRPLYSTVRDVLRDAIDRGVFVPGQQMPSTKDLSEQLDVSLVTAHRALQELVTAGVLQRSQGRGTFVHEKYPERKHTISRLPRRAALPQRRVARRLLPRPDPRRRAPRGRTSSARTCCCSASAKTCATSATATCWSTRSRRRRGVREPAAARAGAGRRARCEFDDLTCFDVDNVDMARLAVKHLAEQGHRCVGYVGGAYQVSNSQDRWQGFTDSLPRSGPRVLRSALVKANGLAARRRERAELAERCGRPTARPRSSRRGTAFALEVYGAARRRDCAFRRTSRSSASMTRPAPSICPRR